MPTITASSARAQIYRLIESAGKSHVPVVITGKKNNAVLISEDDWNSIQETLYLISIPGMRESIQNGMKTPLKNCDTVLEW